MKKNAIRIVGLVLVAAMMFVFVSCGADNKGNNVILVSFVYENGESGGSNGGDTENPTPQAPTTPVDTPTEAPTAGTTPTEAPTAGTTPTEAPTAGTTPTEAPTAGTTPTEAPGDGLPKDAASILKKYTEVMDQLKNDKPGFNKKEYQAVPKENLQIGSIGSIVSPIIDSFMTSAEEAEEQTHDKGSEMKYVPVNENTKGCLLTDASKIKTATCEKDGTNWKIVIVLADEVDPEPTPAGTNAPVSYHGAVFSPLSRSSIQKELDGIKVITVNRFNLTYHDCTATIVFNPENNHVVSLTQIMNIGVDANVKVLVTLDIKGLVINNMSMYNFAY